MTTELLICDCLLVVTSPQCVEWALLEALAPTHQSTNPHQSWQGSKSDEEIAQGTGVMFTKFECMTQYDSVLDEHWNKGSIRKSRMFG